MKKGAAERVAGIEPACACLEGRNFLPLSYTREISAGIMRGSAGQSTAIVPFSQPVAAGSR